MDAVVSHGEMEFPVVVEAATGCATSDGGLARADRVPRDMQSVKRTREVQRLRRVEDVSCARSRYVFGESSTRSAKAPCGLADRYLAHCFACKMRLRVAGSTRGTGAWATRCVASPATRGRALARNRHVDVDFGAGDRGDLRVADSSQYGVANRAAPLARNEEVPWWNWRTTATASPSTCRRR